MQRTHTCGQLRDSDIGKIALLQGWFHSRRDHGGLIFIDLRDRYGLTQIVFDPRVSKETHEAAGHLKREDVVSVKGKIHRRKPDMENSKLDTGMVEVFIEQITILNKAETPPLEIDDRVQASEENRLKYRYLDLRRPVMQKLMSSRFEAAMAVRNTLKGLNFIEVETPMLIKPTPEGARDYIVPSRINPGKFYALPQSPQLYKQILMIAGMDRYFQLARCLRDEDLRADRQPEHTQIDIEMSFVEREDVFDVVEKVLAAVWETKGVALKTPFPRMPHAEAVAKYGSDKPDLRYELFLHDVTSIAEKSEFSVFKNVVKAGGIVKCIAAPKDLSRNEIDDLILFCQKHGAKGMAWMRVTEKGMESSITKFFPEQVQKDLIKAASAKPGSIMMFIADKAHIANQVLDKLRQELAKRLGIIKDDGLRFCWVVDFPFFDWNEEEGKWDAAHNPFSMIREKDLEYLESDPGKVHCLQYDLVLNGWELGSGSIRINKPELQERVLKVLGLSKEQVEAKFGFLLEAYKYGAPIHGGIGIGFDRVVALLNGTQDIREVIAFPKNKSAECPMDGSPSDAEEKQLKELHIKLDIVKEQKNALFSRIVDALNREKMKHEVIEHKAVFTSKDAAEARGTELKQGCKALILKTEEGYIQAVVPGDREIDLKKLQRITLFRHLELGSAADVKRVSGCDIGAVPPFGNLMGLKVYFDKRVTENEIVAFNAGSHSKSITMRAKDLRQLVNPVIAEFSK